MRKIALAVVTMKNIKTKLNFKKSYFFFVYNITKQYDPPNEKFRIYVRVSRIFPPPIIYYKVKYLITLMEKLKI